MNQQRIGMYATIAAWVSVILAMVLTLTLGGQFIVLLVFAAITAISVSAYWARKTQQSR